MIKILGAGPSGLAAAIHLSQHGMPVTVYEKRGAVGSRFHNDIQGLENWSSRGDILERLRSLAFDLGPVCTPVREGIVEGPAARARLRSDAPFFYLVKRGQDPGSLDDFLKEQALRQGVKIVFNADVRSAECDIIASGPRQPSIFGYGQVFRTDSDDAVIAILNNAVIPRGYAYLLILGRSATLAVIHFGGVRDARSCLALAIERFRSLLDFRMDEPRTFAGFGSFHPPRSAVAEGRLLVGEAAGFQDDLFGFGMRYALLSGILAARSILDGSDYDRLWRKEFGRELKASLRNRALYARLGPILQNCFVRGLQRSRDPRRLLERCYRGSLLWLPFRV